MNARIILSFLTMCSVTLAMSQDIRELKIGDKVPNIEIKNIVNYPNARARLNDFRGKLLIIDFWETYCGGCIAALPKIQELQKELQDKIQVITVTSTDNKETVLNTLNRFNVTKNLNLPIVIRDSVLRKLFPFKLVSHVVWIDQSGIVKAITEKDYITKENIKTALGSKNLNWPIKKDVLDFDYNLPLLTFAQSSSPASSSSYYYSAFTGHIDGIDATNSRVIDSAKSTIILNFYNANLLQLCQCAVDAVIGGPNPKNVVFNVKDKGRYIRGKQFLQGWSPANEYSYSIMLPLKTSEKERNEFIKADLSRWLEIGLRIKAKKERQKVTCLVLTRINKDDYLLKAKGAERTELTQGTTRKRMINSQFGNLTWYLNYETDSLPWVYDETGIPPDMLVDMEFNAFSFENVESLRHELNRYGLDLVQEKREREVFVITEEGYEGGKQ